MRCSSRFLAAVITPALLFVTVQTCAGQSTPAPVAPVPNPCSRPAAGSVVSNPPALYSSGGLLSVRFSYQTVADSAGRNLFCFMTPNGLENPTLHVNPGDTLSITVTNNLGPGTGPMSINAPNCGASVMNSSSMNIHYHGTNTSPTCHSDEVIKTTINPNETFQYNIVFPENEPPGLYWYHPHIHGIAEHAVLGGASGAIVVDGIEDVQPAVSELPERILIVRDQNVPGTPTPNGNIPSWDVTLNNVPITSPASSTGTNWVPAILQMPQGTKEFFRVTNSSADTILDLQYVFDGQAQPMQIVAVDGVSVNSQDGNGPGSTIGVKHFVLPPASRVEFIVSSPSGSVKLAQLVTLGINTGPLGDDDPQRPLATIQLTNGDDGGGDEARVRKMPKSKAWSKKSQRFAGLAAAPIAAHRTVYFDENCAPLSTGCSPNQFFMGVVGKPEHVFDPNLPPDIVATQGTVEEWVIQNRAGENHEFHFHQVHFLVESQDNFEINGSVPFKAVTGQYLDMVQVPYWDGNVNHPFPSVTVRIDFRGPDVGEFVFHCHILNHEDQGMMNIIQVVAPGSAASTPAKRSEAVSAEHAAHSMDIADRVVKPAAQQHQHQHQ